MSFSKADFHRYLAHVFLPPELHFIASELYMYVSPVSIPCVTFNSWLTVRPFMSPELPCILGELLPLFVSPDIPFQSW